MVLIAAVALYGVASLLLMAFGANLVRMAVVAWRADARVTHGREQPTDALPRVTVQVPVYNERYVARRAVESACALRYPRDRLQIQILDDSTDDTVDIVAAAVAAAREAGVDIVHVRRGTRSGYKAGALAHGLATATGELVAVFDADFVPPADFLLRLVGEFATPDVAFVQARWTHLNADHSLLTRLQAVAIDAHFAVEQAARGRRGHWFNFNGTAGIWRRAAIESAGGWTADTLTEDLDLSYRAHLAGWRGVYRGDVAVPGEIPADIAALRRQQHRWARGSIECARRLLGPVWRAPVDRGVKLQATAHLCAYGVHLLLLLVTVLYPAVVLAGDELPRVGTLFGLAPVLAVASLAPVVFLAAGQARLGRSPWRTLPLIGVLIVVGSGLMVNTARAVVDIWRRPDAGFERTAKFGLDDGDRAWTAKRYQLPFDRIVVVELVVGIYALGTAWLAWDHRSLGIALYAAVFGLGLMTVAATTVAQHLRSTWVRRRGPAERVDESRLGATVGP